MPQISTHGQAIVGPGVPFEYHHHMLDLFSCPLDHILMRRKSLRRELAATPHLQDIRIAVLGGSTTDEFVNYLELLLLSAGLRPAFYQSEYGRYYEDAVLDSDALLAFKPDLVYIHTNCLNIRQWPVVASQEADLTAGVEAELDRYRAIWNALESKLSCQIVQNNFDPAPTALLGNMDAVSAGGRTRFLAELNLAFAHEAAQRPRLLLQDLNRLSAETGLGNWFSWDRYFSYKLPLSAEANLAVARSLASLVRAIYGRSRKVLVLDLDNTLWGGVIGDDGVGHIELGRETPVAEAYTAFQEYCLSLRDRGILLAVCSKNDNSTAESGFKHPNSVLKRDDFASFQANWEPKHENLLRIAEELNLGLESFVFIDDNPAERALVRAQLPSVAVPEIGSDVSHYIEIIQQNRYFEPVAISREDTQRNAQYAENTQRAAHRNAFDSYHDYLLSLEMTAEIAPFQPVYMERIAQLTNKTNQFNLTTRRYTLAELESAANTPGTIALYGRLQDKFGDNGLISVVLGHREGAELHLDLWLMSCRVLKRDMELAMLDALVVRAKDMGIETLIGYYLPTAKNGMVADFYPKLGFLPVPTKSISLPNDATVWMLPLDSYTRQNTAIRITETFNA
jgi:FkbH-like protein